MSARAPLRRTEGRNLFGQANICHTKYLKLASSRGSATARWMLPRIRSARCFFDRSNRGVSSCLFVRENKRDTFSPSFPRKSVAAADEVVGEFILLFAVIRETHAHTLEFIGENKIHASRKR